VPARRVLLYLVLAGLLARILYLHQVAALPFFQDPVGDSALYLQRAREILGGDLVGSRPFFYGGIFYPYLIALSFLVFGPNIYAICLAQAGAGCALAWILFRLARVGLVDRRPGDAATAGLLAAGMALFYGPFAFLEADLLMISWTLLFMMAAALLLLAGRDGSLARLTAAGVCLGLAASERPNLIALVPAAAVWAWVFVPKVRRWKGAAALVAGGGFVLAGAAALNAAACGRPVLLTTSSGINFYIGNHPGARGTYEEPWSGADAHFTARHTDLEASSLMMARRLSGQELDPVEASRFWWSRGLQYLRSHPAEAFRLYLRKLMLFWNAQEIPNHLNFSFVRSVAPSLWLMPLSFAIIGPVGLYGLVAPSARRMMTRPAASLLCILVLVPMATVLPFFVAERYRAPVVPPLILGAACGALDLWRMLGSPLTRRSATLRLACVGLAALAMTRPLTSFDASRDHWLLAQAHKKQGDLGEAARRYEQALAAAAAPTDQALLRNNLGVVLEQSGDASRAEAQYRKAIQADPTLAFPHKNLGLLLMRAGRANEAFDHLVAAERAEPEDIDLARALAVALLVRGETASARAHAVKVLAALPEDRTAAEVIRAAQRATPP